MCKNNRLRIAFYGKGGIGKSTIASNISAAFSNLGLKVLHVGCDPKGDSTRTLVGKKIPSVLKMIQMKDNCLEKEDILYKGYNGVCCVEAGGPEAGIGCAGMGIKTTFEELQYLGVLDETWDVEIYDVLGDVVCGGFSVPMKERIVDVIYIVTSSEFMSIYAANNIMKSIGNFSTNSTPMFGGIIHNHRNLNHCNKTVQLFSEMTDVSLIDIVPFSKEIIISELEGKTTVERYPVSQSCNIFLDLAQKILDNNNYSVPKALGEDELEAFSKVILEEQIKESPDLYQCYIEDQQQINKIDG
jgi:nitrogenase iron protein NifH